MAINFTPSPGFMLLKITEQPSGEILMTTDTDKTPASQGVVIAVGEEYVHHSGEHINTKVKIGDLVIFKPYGTDTLYLDGEEFRIISFENLRGVLK